ncbi:bifunctional UDP-N-acetylglucosamine diphosphorylase/glucosamine-1-phosphate N-acetyltransferase GlmU [Temperatibacter marinus]|uniref:Bifunctional protein GlmU n=1 Tax=Temperatibacter marinus TaxID=1456591 RepID=A0AA52EIZ0_9PROT|nr:bifunctional UDP-N-acetylglucosamine diphosphorylase/glucosamine-1-phosphate N-acetyltransferase GlmU [Temperatibacter marinus]WND03149.1 bifunctional UDP-N-acetylglucosamine diphosphorylase/glucosamine-1-phosphate N-acetyltransferase GlmU [Temperatibacter marinus]
MSHQLSVIILAAGKGTRMKSDLHKVLHPIAGKPMIHHLVEAVQDLAPDEITLVVGALKEQVMEAVPMVAYAEQKEQLGTGHAVKIATDSFKNQAADVLILYGDVPFIPASIMQDMLDSRKQSGAVASVLGFTPKDAARYGRLKLDAEGGLESIVEYKDASEAERNIPLCNSGMMAVDGTLLPTLLSKLSNDNASGEYYLTDIVEIGRKMGKKISVTHACEEDVMGVNSRSDLAQAEAIFQTKMRTKMMDNGITMIDPNSVYFSADTVIDPDVVIEPNVFIGPQVKIMKGAVIKAFSHLEGAVIGKRAQIGPYARLRPGTKLHEDTKVGNFVETKKAIVGPGSKINHLSYVGDSLLGKKVNVGAGTITCNYDGYNKSVTEMGDGSFIGSNTSLVAPVKVGEGAIVAAGSTITKDVTENSLASERAKQTEISGFATKFRARALAKKEKMKKG